MSSAVKDALGSHGCDTNSGCENGSKSHLWKTKRTVDRDSANVRMNGAAFVSLDEGFSSFDGAKMHLSRKKNENSGLEKNISVPKY